MAGCVDPPPSGSSPTARACTCAPPTAPRPSGSAARAHHRGNIRAGGVDRDVTFVEIPADDPINEQLDAGYREKYRDYGPTYVDLILTEQARAATLKLVPH